MSLGQMDGSRVSKCAYREPGGFGGLGDAQICQNQGSWIMHTEKTVM